MVTVNFASVTSEPEGIRPEVNCTAKGILRGTALGWEGDGGWGRGGGIAQPTSSSWEPCVFSFRPAPRLECLMNVNGLKKHRAILISTNYCCYCLLRQSYIYWLPTRRAGHLGFADLQCSYKKLLLGHSHYKIYYFWARTTKLSNPLSNLPNRRCRMYNFSLYRNFK